MIEIAWFRKQLSEKLYDSLPDIAKKEPRMHLLLLVALQTHALHKDSNRIMLFLSSQK